VVFYENLGFDFEYKDDGKWGESRPISSRCPRCRRSLSTVVYAWMSRCLDVAKGVR
jgi:hypothetical protein